MQFTTSITSQQCNLEASDQIDGYNLPSVIFRLLRRHLLSGLTPQEIRDIDEPTLVICEEKFGQESDGHRFALDLYRKLKGQILAEQEEHGYNDLELNEDTLQKLGTREFYEDIVRYYVFGIDDFPDDDKEFKPSARLSRWIFEELSVENKQAVFLCDLNFDALVLCEHKDEAFPIYSFTQHPLVAAVNLLLSIIFEIPLTQHLGSAEELDESLQSGIWLGCLADCQWEECHLLRRVKKDQVELGSHLHFYRMMGSVSLITPTQFLQRDEVMLLREELLAEKALRSVINLPRSLSFLSTLGVLYPDRFGDLQSIWSFSFQNPCPGFRFVDASAAFKGGELGTSPYDIEPSLEMLTKLLCEEADEIQSFQISEDGVTAPLAMLRLIDYQKRDGNLTQAKQDSLPVSEFFDLVLDTERFEHPRKPALVNVFSTDSYDGLWELLEPEDGEPDPQFTDQEKFEFLIHPSLPEGRIQIITDGDRHEAFREYFGLRLKESSPLDDPRVLFLLLADDEFLKQITPYLHGTSIPKIHPEDFMRARITLPSEDVLEQMRQSLKRTSGAWMGRSSRDFLRGWQVDSRWLNSLWRIERPEDDLEGARQRALRDLRQEFDEELNAKAHILVDKVAKIMNPLECAKRLLRKHAVELQNVKHPKSGRTPSEHLTNSSRKCEALNGLIEDLTSVTRKRSMVEPYSIGAFLEEEKEIFEGFDVEIEPLVQPDPPTSPHKNEAPPAKLDPLTKLHKDDFRMVLENISSNAWKHGNFSSEKIGARMRVRMELRNQIVSVHFENNGNGLPRDFTTDMFIRKGERQGESRGSGRGGHDISEAMKKAEGSVAIKNISGSEFRVRLTLSFPLNTKQSYGNQWI